MPKWSHVGCHCGSSLGLKVLGLCFQKPRGAARGGGPQISPLRQDMAVRASVSLRQEEGALLGRSKASRPARARAKECAERAIYHFGGLKTGAAAWVAEAVALEEALHVDVRGRGAAVVLEVLLVPQPTHDPVIRGLPPDRYHIRVQIDAVAFVST